MARSIQVEVPERARLTDRELTEAREWVADCEWADLDAEDVPFLSAEQLVRAIETHWEGGLSAFRLAVAS
jgi:hypothetical protein